MSPFETQISTRPGFVSNVRKYLLYINHCLHVVSNFLFLYIRYYGLHLVTLYPRGKHLSNEYFNGWKVTMYNKCPQLKCIAV